MTEFFSFRGRLNRRAYFFRNLVLGIVPILLFDIPKAYNITLSVEIKILFFMFVLTAVTLVFFQNIKRLHDIDKSGWYSLLLLIPFVNIVFGLYILFKKGTEGINRFGDDPLSKPNTTSKFSTIVYSLIIFILLFVIIGYFFIKTQSIRANINEQRHLIEKQRGNIKNSIENEVNGINQAIVQIKKELTEASGDKKLELEKHLQNMYNHLDKYEKLKNDSKENKK